MPMIRRVELARPSWPHRDTRGGDVPYSRRMSSIYDLRMTSITGDQVSFDQFRDQVLLIVNVASA